MSCVHRIHLKEGAVIDEFPNDIDKWKSAALSNYLLIRVQVIMLYVFNQAGLFFSELGEEAQAL